MTEFGKVAVLLGGSSAEREISLKSGQAVLAGLLKAGVDAHPFDPSERALTELAGFDRAFVVLHGRGGEDGTLQGALEHMAMPYTGSGVLGCALAMDKVRTKSLWAGQGLPTAAFEVAVEGRFKAETASQMLSRLGGKVMVKPANEGSSIGMAIAETPEQLAQAIAAAHEFDREVLVEQWIDGPEFTVAILGERALPVIEMRTDNAFYDYQAKYQSNETRYLCPCELPEQEELELRALALTAFRAVGASGWGRVDVMRTRDGRWQLLEVNAVPGMTETSLVPKAARAVGIDFPTLVTTILAQTVE
ncbi:D-alanine--D-alanine ligase [Ferrimonas sediminicola]|uniref:D-alanine--D-alanine ligase n=1 Tax=Ferrimonas sediminicola TaxID=2569538 RepID=A0A4U1BJB6_9GAMM|nr:D-alanine--D-alanine ligase [Ferrimonas sediminicola]TKB51272.1 D-alanine--D-alanine ligase [Ferrimonas sediminicola]